MVGAHAVSHRPLPLIFCLSHPHSHERDRGGVAPSGSSRTLCRVAHTVVTLRGHSRRRIRFAGVVGFCVLARHSWFPAAACHDSIGAYSCAARWYRALSPGPTIARASVGAVHASCSAPCSFRSCARRPPSPPFVFISQLISSTLALCCLNPQGRELRTARWSAASVALVLVSLLGLSAVVLVEGRGGGGAAGDAASKPLGNDAKVGPGRYCYSRPVATSTRLTTPRTAPKFETTRRARSDSFFCPVARSRPSERVKGRARVS